MPNKNAGPAKIPSQGVDHDALLEQMQSFRQDDADWHAGRTWSLVYHVSDEHSAFLKKAHNLFFSENGLNPMAFKSLKRMESEVVQMTASMLNAPGDAVGTMTSGGTESILLAVKTYRDRARRLKPWIRSPEIVVPESIHVAFDKAGHYFDVKIRRVPTGEDWRADVKAMKKAIGRNTIAVGASATQYPQGVVDPIAELGAICEEKRLPFHVDGCIGGFMLPWVERLGYPVPTWDFRVPGVTSISADVHKYGYAAKGASTVIYRSMDYLKHQFFVSTDWSGGIYASPSMPGTRPGGCISAAWAAMNAMGEDGYLEVARGAMEATERLKEGLRAIPELQILGDPHMTLVAYASADETVDLYAVADQMEKKGWNVDRQQYPASVHCTVNANHLEVLDDYLADLREAVAHVKAHPELKAEGNAAMYGMMAKVPLRGMVKASVLKVMEGMYGPDGEAPDLSKVGEGEDDGLLLQMINRYGDQAMEVLERLDGVRDRIKSALGR